MGNHVLLHTSAFLRVGIKDNMREGIWDGTSGHTNKQTKLLTSRWDYRYKTKQWCFSSHWCLFDSLWLHEANPWSQHE